MKLPTIAVMLASLWSAQVLACRCVEPGPRSAYTRADAVAMVHVKEVAELPGDVVRVEGEVTQSWKSQLPNALKVFTGEDCKYSLAKGGSYLLYLKRGVDGEFGTYMCRGNLPEAEAKNRLRWLDRHGKAAVK